VKNTLNREKYVVFRPVLCIFHWGSDAFPGSITDKIVMCGIIAYVGPREVRPILLDGLSRLEYRGYDSAGMATLADGQIDIQKKVGRIAELTRQRPPSSRQHRETGHRP
jgi:hypothetical protein